MTQASPSFSLTEEQFDKLAAFIEAAAYREVSEGLQKNLVLLGVARRKYADRKEAAKKALVVNTDT